MSASVGGPGPAAAQDVQVTGSLQPATGSIGDPVTLTVAVIHDRGATVEPPALHVDGGRLPLQAGGKLGKLDILAVHDAITAESPGGRTETRFTYDLTTLEVGAHDLPGLFVAVKSPSAKEAAEIAVPPQKLEVKSVLKDSEKGQTLDIKDIKGPLTVPPDYTLWAEILLGAAALALLALLLRRLLRRRRAPVVSGPPPLPPYEEAVRALDALKSERLPAQGLWKEFALRLSEIARRYLHRRYGVLALEATTREVMRGMAEADDMMRHPGRERLLGRLRHLLEETDLVKFARYVPPLSAENDLLALCFQLLEETRPNAAPSPVAPPATPVEVPA